MCSELLLSDGGGGAGQALHPLLPDHSMAFQPNFFFVIKFGVFIAG
jgi:hypothetical protein